MNRAWRQTADSEALREQWQVLSSELGWAYASDWQQDSVDALCEAMVELRDPWDAAERLGRDRAAAGVGLAETLSDIDALTTLVPDDNAEQLRRAVSLGWSEVATAPQVSLIDPMTGLVSLGYLQLRLGEVYRAGAGMGRPVGASHALVIVRIRSTQTGLGRRLPMVVVADALRSVFDAGETLALLSDSVIAVLCRRDQRLPARAGLAQTLGQRMLDRDELAGPVSVAGWIEPLPGSVALATAMLADLSR
ncbi:hypothetical protein [Nakamurella lactea]|uniref:hypothetical protein n=1 Tax=Nakamurella lactea TaxID=459515 RepID=UPI000408E069|nr:hypothetical protein [Nakamurella lactea]